MSIKSLADFFILFGEFLTTNVGMGTLVKEYSYSVWGSALDIGHIWVRKKIDLDDYISRLESEGKEDNLEELKKLQDEGIETLIKVVEIKSDEEQDEATPAKEEYAKAHFERVNEKLSILNLADIEDQYRGDAKQYYTFDLLQPKQYQSWIADLKKGKLC